MLYFVPSHHLIISSSAFRWNWSIGMMFGAIMSATDPVAVVALLKELGVKFD